MYVPFSKKKKVQITHKYENVLQTVRHNANVDSVYRFFYHIHTKRVKSAHYGDKQTFIECPFYR